MWKAITEWGASHRWWLVGFTLFSFVGSLVALRFVVAKLPLDYFLPSEQRAPRPRRTLLQWLGVVLANLLGLLLVATGVLLLFLPGQGFLTLLLGISLLSFPGRQRLLCRLTRPLRVRRSLNFLRRHVGSPELKFEAQEDSQGEGSDL